MAQAIASKSGSQKIIEGVFTGTQHEIGSAVHPCEGSGHRGNTVPGEAFRPTQKREIMDGDHMRGIGRSRDDRCGMAQINLSGDRFHFGPVRPQPGLIEPWPCERQGRHLATRTIRSSRESAMPSRHRIQIHLRVQSEAFSYLQGRNGSSTGHLMPTLLKGVRNTNDL
jgi:hypothetical protein